MRNFFIHDDRIIALAKYNKSQSMMERPKVIPHYIFPAQSHLYIAYDADVLPFMQMLQLDGITPPETIIINHVWSDANDEPRETHHVSDIMGRESTKVLGVRLTLLSSLSWRNIGIAMDQELLQNASSRLLEDNKFMAPAGRPHPGRRKPPLHPLSGHAAGDLHPVPLRFQSGVSPVA